MQGNTMGGCKRKKDCTPDKQLCGVYEEKGSTKLEDCNFTQNQPTKQRNCDKNCGMADSRATPVYLIPTPHNGNMIPLTRPITFETVGAYNFKNKMIAIF